ncbi:hypothetical protein OC834_007108 [Tilletia horrida]|nr:hypothetical protein OC834_007108 [Tilletia horrida]
MPTLSDLPGELVLHVLKEAIPTDPEQVTTLRSHVQGAGEYRLIGRRFNIATQLLVGVHFHAFPGPTLNVLQIWSGLWHPSQTKPAREHRRYWNSYRHPEDYRHSAEAVRTLPVYRLPALRSLSLDLIPRRQSTSVRIPDITRPFSLPTEVTTLLDRIRTHSHSIEQLHIRIPAVQECIDAVQTIVATNINLHSVCIEVDSVRCATTFGGPRPRFHLSNFSFAHLGYSALQRFVLRAPTCDVNFILSPHSQLTFLRRLVGVVQFGLICNHFSTTLPNWYWVYTLFQHTPQLQACDISFQQNDDHESFKPDFEVQPFALPHLYELCLDLPEIDSFLLCKMTAPKLYVLRLRSNVHIHLWPDCDINQFPDLFLVQMHCPGPSAVRLDTLGVMHQYFSHNLSGNHNYLHSHDEDFTAYIKPYERPREQRRPMGYQPTLFRQLPPPIYRPTVDVSTSLPVHAELAPNLTGPAPDVTSTPSSNNAPATTADSAANPIAGHILPDGPSTVNAFTASAISTFDSPSSVNRSVSPPASSSATPSTASTNSLASPVATTPHFGAGQNTALHQRLLPSRSPTSSPPSSPSAKRRRLAST